MMEPWKEHVLHVLGPESEHARLGGAEGAAYLQEVLDSVETPDAMLNLLLEMFSAHTEEHIIYRASVIGSGRLHACIDECAMAWLAVRYVQRRTLS